MESFGILDGVPDSPSASRLGVRAVAFFLVEITNSVRPEVGGPVMERSSGGNVHPISQTQTPPGSGSCSLRAFGAAEKVIQDA